MLIYKATHTPGAVELDAHTKSLFQKWTTLNTRLNIDPCAFIVPSEYRKLEVVQNCLDLVTFKAL